MDECLHCKMPRCMMSRFCQNCGGTLPRTYLEYIISVYFKNDFPYETILKFLKEHHNIVFSSRTSKSKLKEYELRRTRNDITWKNPTMLSGVTCRAQGHYRVIDQYGTVCVAPRRICTTQQCYESSARTRSSRCLNPKAKKAETSLLSQSRTKRLLAY